MTMQIISTEPLSLGSLTATRFLLSTEQHGQIAVTHLAPPEAVEHKAAIVMLPGMFSNRRFWLSDKGIGLAAYLAQHGYSAWMLDRRGLGASSSAHPEHHRLYHGFEIDLPAVQALLQSQGYDSAYYMGHSFGGVLNNLSLAHGHLKAAGVTGLINFSSQLTVGKTLLNKPYSAVIYASTALLGFFPAKRLRMGPENESKQAMRDCCRLVDWAKGKNKASFWQGFERISCPILAFGSDGDSVDPAPGCRELIAPMASTDKTFIQLGKQQGHRRDYDHVGMLVSKDAQGEVWPMLLDWLEQRN